MRVILVVEKPQREELEETWWDLENMKGSTVDAMSDAVDNADVIICCISRAYKESPSESGALPISHRF
eukprot:COSAG02_NODE_18481_length_936_cov_0.504182_2_plen_68_part_00